jgi:hypothetical protein
MTDLNQDALIDTLDRRVERRNSRRDLIAGLVAGGAMLATARTASAQALTDADILNFALNLEYLEAQFYLFAVNGTGLPNTSLTGTGTRGNVRGGRQVNFADTVVRQYAKEIAADEAAHVNFLRAQLGSAAVSMPEVDISADPNGAFSNAARAAGLIGAGQSFDPYASDDNFLLGAFIFEDVGVTAYKGAAPLINSKTFLEASAGILAVEAYHAGLIRTVLYARGVATPSLRQATELISNARDTLDGAHELDEGVAPRGVGATAQSNIVPVDQNGITFSRSAGRVLNIVYLNRQAVAAGGFFPNGVNGTIRTSAAS